MHPFKSYLIFLLSFLFIFIFNRSSGYGNGNDSSWSVLLLKKGNNLILKTDMASYSNTGFYLYRNCIYHITLQRHLDIDGRLVGIKRDTLYFTEFIDKKVASRARAILDTLAVPYQQLDKLYLVEGRSYGVYSSHSFDEFNFIFKKDTANYLIQSRWERISDNDSTLHELVPLLSEKGIWYLFEDRGVTYYYSSSGIYYPEPAKVDYTYHKRYVFCFTPCKVEQINGFAFGVLTKNIKNTGYGLRDSLLINGISLELNIEQLFGFPFLLFKFNGDYPDSSVSYYNKIKKDWELRLHGLNITLFDNLNDARIYGVNISGFVTIVDEIHGLSVSGINNFSYIADGVTIATVRNRASIAKGVQIALINKCDDLRGIQIGLWNINGKRSLPFINWQFRP